MTTTYVWHIHHGILIEPLTSPIEERITYIKAEKPAGEQALRLRLLKPVLGALPAAYVEAETTYRKARAAYIKARAAYVEAKVAFEKATTTYEKARVAFEKAKATYDLEIEALHRIECPNCPWNGKTIFPSKE